ncbi:hypothetical protein [Borrelia duttonii]|uniref:hypothetical protein n=1 Tax=Borrelia duttonii TaxID=40834 RepID=UPI0004B77979|nr:hypothetical protein [Borrelia duttonii]
MIRNFLFFVLVNAIKSGMYAIKPMCEYPILFISFGIAKLVSNPENAAREKYFVFILFLFCFVFVYKNILYIQEYRY